MKTRCDNAWVSLCLLILAAGCTSPERRADEQVEQARGYPSATTNKPAPAISLKDMNDADRALASVVRDQFDRYGALGPLARNVVITTHQGTVTLVGRVPDEQARKMIRAMVENTPGVLAVDEQIQLTSPTPLPYNQTERALVNRVRQALLEQSAVATFAPNLEIKAAGGTVSLSGNVPSPGDRDAIVVTVKSVTGVADVLNQIQVPPQPTGRPAQDAAPKPAMDSGGIFRLKGDGLNESDRAVGQRILQGLRTEQVLSSLLPVVNIQVADGKATLRGTVPSDDQRRTIVSAAREAAGEENVLDELKLQPPTAIEIDQ